MNRPQLAVADVPDTVQGWLPPRFSLAPLEEGDPADTALATGRNGEAVLKRARGRPDAAWIEAELRALVALAETDLPVPRALGLHIQEGPPAEAWLVTTRLPGRPLSVVLRTSRPSERAAWCERLGRMLARIQTTEPPEALAWVDATPWVRRRHNRLPADRAPDALRSVHLDEPEEDPQVLVHGDFTPDNVLAAGDEITGVIDWPGAGTGSPNYDLATALLSLRQLVAEDGINAFVGGYVDELARRADP